MVRQNKTMMMLVKYAVCALLLTVFGAAISSDQKESNFPSNFQSLSSSIAGTNAVVPDVVTPNVPKPPPPIDDSLSSLLSTYNETQSKEVSGSNYETRLNDSEKVRPSLLSVGKFMNDIDTRPSENGFQKQVLYHTPPPLPPPPPPKRAMQHYSIDRNRDSDTVVHQQHRPYNMPPRPPPIFIRKEEKHETIIQADTSIGSREIKLPPPRPTIVNKENNQNENPDKLTVMPHTPLTPPPPPKFATPDDIKQHLPYQYQQRKFREELTNHSSQASKPVEKSYDQQQNKYMPMHRAPDPKTHHPLPYQPVAPTAQYQSQRPLPQAMPPVYQPEGWQQNKWHQQSRPSRIHSLPYRRLEQRKPPSTSSLLTSLWQKVERGLDGLANVESTVTEQAQQFIVRRRSLHPNHSAKIQQRNRRSQTTAPQQRLQSHIDKANNKPANTSADSNSMRQIDWASVQAGRRVVTNSGGSASIGPESAPRLVPLQTALGSHEQVTLDAPHDPSSRAESTHISKTTADHYRQQPVLAHSGDRRPSEFRNPPQTSANRPVDLEERHFLDEEDFDNLSILDRISRLIPRFPSLRLHRGMSGELARSALAAWEADDEESQAQKNGLFSFFRKPSSGYKKIVETSELDIPAVMSLNSRFASGTCQNTILKPSEVQTCQAIGGQKAAFDVLSVGFLMIMVQQLQSLGGVDVHVVANRNTENLLKLWSCALESWAPYALACAFLSWQQGRNLAKRKELQIIATATESAMVDANYGAMLLRLTTGSPINRRAIELVLLGVRSQISSVVGNARLQTFAFASVLFMGMLWGPDFRSIIVHLVALLASLKGLAHWPVDIRSTVSSAQSALEALWLTLAKLMADFATAMFDHPVLFSFRTLICVSLIVVSIMPRLIRQRHEQEDYDRTDAEDEEEDDRMFRTFTEQLVGFGASGANRLNLLADNLLETLLNRWVQLMSNKQRESNILRFSVRSIAKKYWLCLLSSMVLLAPFSFYLLDGIDARSSNTLTEKLGSFFDISCVFVAAQMLVWDAISKISISARLNRKTHSFLESVSTSMHEREKEKIAHAPAASTDFNNASFSTTSGLSVSNMWTSYKTKRAWALKGVSFTCRNGEVVVVLSCDSYSRSHLVRAVAEALTGSASASRAFVPAQGTLSFGGLDVQTWDKKLLRKRVGIFLNDVRSMSDFAQVLSGLSLEEILCPRELGDHSEKELQDMILALKLTGLYSTLLPRLPSKLATTVTASEEDLRSLRPRCEFLSPAEWRKLLLARVLAKAIYCNEDSVSAGTALNSLVGSIIVIEDFSAYLSEADEALLVKELRRTGAACIVTTERWNTGRFADKVVIMRDGTIIEAGTHQELTSKGVQRSIYAAQIQNALG